MCNQPLFGYPCFFFIALRSFHSFTCWDKNQFSLGNFLSLIFLEWFWKFLSRLIIWFLAQYTYLIVVLIHWCLVVIVDGYRKIRECWPWGQSARKSFYTTHAPTHSGHAYIWDSIQMLTHSNRTCISRVVNFFSTNSNIFLHIFNYLLVHDLSHTSMNNSYKEKEQESIALRIVYCGFNFLGFISSLENMLGLAFFDHFYFS